MSDLDELISSFRRRTSRRPRSTGPRRTRRSGRSCPRSTASSPSATGAGRSPGSCCSCRAIPTATSTSCARSGRSAGRSGSWSSAELIGWARQIDLLGIGEDLRVKPQRDAVFERVRQIFENAMRRSYTRCKNHELDDIVRLMKFARVGALLGMAFGQEARDAALNCARFEVQFTSRISGSSSGACCEGDGTAAMQKDYRVASTVLAEIEATSLIRGKAPIAHEEGSAYHSETDMDCGDKPNLLNTTDLVGTRPGELDLILLFDLQIREPGVEPPPAYDLRIFPMNPFGELAESYAHRARGCGADPAKDYEVWESWWEHDFVSFHRNQIHGFFTDGYVPGSGDLIASKTSNQTDDPLTERSTLKVLHRPR